MIEEATCVVLVGGEASRMGGLDKGAVEFRGLSLVDRVLKVVKPLFSEIIISAHNSDYQKEGFNVISDRLPGRGPALGICAALQEASNPWLFVVSCDLPALKEEVVTELAAKRDAFDAVVPRIDERLQTLVAFYKKSCLAPLTERVKEGRRSLGGFIEDAGEAGGLKIRLVEAAELLGIDPKLESFLDIDTFEELDRMEALLENEL